MSSSSDQLIVSVSGVRGVIGAGLTPQVALAFAQALAIDMQGGTVVLGRDGRPSGVMLRHAILAGLTAAGCTVHDLGVAATPTVGIAVRTLGAAGGIQITASHNPAQWNGLKLFGPDGRVLSASAGERIRKQFEIGASYTVAHADVGSVRHYRLAEEVHGDTVLGLVDGARIRAARFVALLDGNGGAGGPLGKRLLESMAVETICHGCDADGHFAHEPEPTEENLKGIAPLVRLEECDIGFALDPDSDRLALIDENGRYIGEELTLALATLCRLRREKGPVVVNMSTSRVTEDIAKKFGCAFHRSAVGEANVADKMREVGAVIGGEGNGGVIDPRVGYVRDPFIGMALVLNLMAETNRKLSELVADLPAYTIIKDKYTLDRSLLPRLYDAVLGRHPEAKSDTIDGLRLDWEDRWVHIRPSNTEPIVRVIAEAPQAEAAAGLCKAVGEVIAALA